MRLIFLVILAVVLLRIALTIVQDYQEPDATQQSGPAVSAADAEQLRNCRRITQNDQNVECVHRLQGILRARGAPIKQTGNYQSATAEAVEQYQQIRGLPKKGSLADQATLKALTDLPSGGAKWDLRRECVSMRHINGGANSHGQADSQGRCVVELRRLLNERGAELPDSNQFDEATEVEARAFQLRARLPVLGIVGPQTKDALYKPSPPIDQLTATPTCAPTGCAMYLSRGMTDSLADIDAKNDPSQYAISSALSVLACRRAKALSLDVVCQAVASYIVDTAIKVTTVVDKARQARDQKACLVVNLGYPPGSTSWLPLSLTIGGGPHCRR